MASQVPGARSHHLPLRGRASLPGALRPPTNHEERWGDHSFALDSVMLDGAGAPRLFSVLCYLGVRRGIRGALCAGPRFHYPTPPEAGAVRVNAVRRWLGPRRHLRRLSSAREHPPPPLRA
jgi:hypothetical protein